MWAVSRPSRPSSCTWRGVSCSRCRPADWNLTIAWILVTFEALPLAGLILKAWSVWNIDSHPPAPVSEAPDSMRVAVLIPTYNEPIEVLTPTVAAACKLDPGHETWVLDDGDRPWVEEMSPPTVPGTSAATCTTMPRPAT